MGRSAGRGKADALRGGDFEPKPLQALDLLLHRNLHPEHRIGLRGAQRDLFRLKMLRIRIH